MSYLSLGDYGLIGNQTSAALISRLGSIDWCCLPYLDSPSHFAALLDPVEGGRFQICPLGDFRSEQRYLQRTHVLETSFETPSGRAVLTDWMPMTAATAEGGSRPVIFRRLEVIDGRVPWQVTCAPRFQYGGAPATAEGFRGGVLFRARPDLADAEYLAHLRVDSTAARAIALETLGGADPLGLAVNEVRARFTLQAGESATFRWAWGRDGVAVRAESPRATADHWRSLAHRCELEAAESGCLFAGPWHDEITRAGLVLKLLTHPCGGALAEAITTSLAGVPGESRTWDYRFCWVRDGAMAIRAMEGLGMRGESAAFFGWLSDIVIRDGAEGLQPVYKLDGGRSLPETEVDSLSGHQGSSPVRVGNRTSSQFQLDVYGQVMLAAVEYFKAFHQLPDRLWPKLAEIADVVCQAWRRPDQGPWEIRAKAAHYTASKVLAWVALDRAIILARALDIEPPRRWATERDILHRTICDQAVDPRTQAFTMGFGDREPDAATLVIPLVGFLPPDDPRVIATIESVQSSLATGVLVHRYRAPGGFDDGLSGVEGAFVTASFMLVSALAVSGRIEEAGDRLAELCTYATPLGLFAEQVNLATGETSGNFPSASAHVALINAAIDVAEARGRLRVPSRLPSRLSGLPSVAERWRSSGAD